jgi:DNA (cytosine-5)-methyltransferase 1
VDNPSPTHLSLCSGYEGIGLGLKRVFPSCRTIAHVEVEAFACANLVAKMEAGELDSCPLWTNLKTFDGKPFRGLVDILSGGFPCQPFSCAGLQKGDEDPRHLFPSILNVIQDTRPRVVFLENVEGIISAKLKGEQWGDPASTSVLLHVCRELERRGYKTAWGIFSAEEVGAPMSRKRVFICGVADSISSRAETWLPEPEQWQEGVAEITHDGGHRRWPNSPGSQQHEWEEPRLVGNTHSSGPRAEEPGDDGQVLGVQEDQGQEHSASVSGGASGELGNAPSEGFQEREASEQQQPIPTTEYASGEQDGRQAESELDRATDGTASRVDATANRVDRLRLIGNGVVLPTAEIALRTLLDELSG